VRTVAAARPDVFNHNVETVPSQYPRVRPEGHYEWALSVLRAAREAVPAMYTKSGLMVGLGETPAEVEQTVLDLRGADCDILTIGQYLRPSPAHSAVVEFVPPAQFKVYREMALRHGFRHVAAGPFVRSSFNAAAVLTRVQRTAGVSARGEAGEVEDEQWLM